MPLKINGIQRTSGLSNLNGNGGLGNFGGGGGGNSGGNGRFGDNGGFNSIDIEYYLKRIQITTNAFNVEILVKVVMRVREEEERFFLEDTRKIILVELSDLYKKYDIKYEETLNLFRRECQFYSPPCCFSGLEDASKCQLKQLDTLLDTTIEANKLANKLKLFLGIQVNRKHDLKNHYRQIFDHLGTWKMEDGETLESQLHREISLIANSELRMLFSDCLQDLGPGLQTRLRAYEGSAPFGSRKCLLCGYNFSNEILERFPLPNFENKTDPRHFFWSIFRRNFFTGLVHFLIAI